MHLENLVKLRNTIGRRKLSMNVYLKHKDKTGNVCQQGALETPFAELKSDLLHNKCGTAGCIAGWVAVVRGLARPPEQYELSAQKWLKLTDEQGMFLFSARTYMYVKWLYLECTDKEAKLRLRIMISEARKGNHTITREELIEKLQEEMRKMGE